MNVILALLAANALVGLVSGSYFSWVGIALSGPILAILSAIVLQHERFGLFSGVIIIVLCLTIHQIAYWVGISAVASRRTNTTLQTEKSYDASGEEGHKDVACEDPGELPRSSGLDGPR
jgi:hypothetical protein